MRIEPIIQQDELLAHVSGYFCGRDNFNEGLFCKLLQQLTHRKNIQFALVQGASPIGAIVAQINAPTVQGTLVYTKVPYGDWMLGASAMLDICSGARSIAQLTASSEFRWPDWTDSNERVTTDRINSLLELWNKLELLEQQLKATIDHSDDAVRSMWKAAGVTFEYSDTFLAEMHNYINRRGYEHPELVPYIMRSENWRTEQWYPSSRLL